MCLSQGFLGRVHGRLVCSVLMLRQIGCIIKAMLGKPPSFVSAEEVCMLGSILIGVFFFPHCLSYSMVCPGKANIRRVAGSLAFFMSLFHNVELPNFLMESCFSQCEPTNILSCNCVPGKDKLFSWRPLKMSAGSKCCSQRTASGHWPNSILFQPGPKNNFCENILRTEGSFTLRY